MEALSTFAASMWTFRVPSSLFTLPMYESKSVFFVGRLLILSFICKTFSFICARSLATSFSSTSIGTGPVFGSSVIGGTGAFGSSV